MAEPRKIQLTAGNWIMIGIFLVGIITAWAKIQLHITDETIHLTEDQRDNLIVFQTIIDDKVPIINKNTERIIILEKDLYGHKIEYNYLFLELDGLEGKVSRNYVEVRNMIDEMD